MIVETTVAQPIYDTGRLPLWIRLPSALLGLFVSVLWIDLVLEHIVGLDFRLLIAGPISTPLGVAPALVGLALLALFFFQVWFGRKRILFAPEPQQLVVEDYWLAGVWRSRLAVSEIEQIKLKCGRALSSRFWNIYAVSPTVRATWLTRCRDRARARDVAERIATAIGRPVIE